MSTRARLTTARSHHRHRAHPGSPAVTARTNMTVAVGGRASARIATPESTSCAPAGQGNQP